LFSFDSTLFKLECQPQVLLRPGAGIFIPIIAGLVGVFILFPPNPTLACGGSAALIAALLVVIYYSILKKKAAIKIS